MAWFTAKEWKNRLVEFAGRRSLKNVSTNETTVYDVTRNEGQVSQEGDSFSATTMNDLEQRISDAFSEAEEANTQLISEISVINGKLYKDVINDETIPLSLKDAVKYVCDNYVGLACSARGRFLCAEGWYDYDLIKSEDDNCSGIINGHTKSVTYSCYRLRGADAVLKKLGSNIVYIGNSTSIDVKTVLPNDYANLTVDNFVVELASLSANGGAANTGGASYPQFGSVNANSNMTKTYNNGVLTIQGIACNGETYSGDRTWRRYVSASAGIRVYAVY